MMIQKKNMAPSTEWAISIQSPIVVKTYPGRAAFATVGEPLSAMVFRLSAID